MMIVVMMMMMMMMMMVMIVMATSTAAHRYNHTCVCYCVLGGSVCVCAKREYFASTPPQLRVAIYIMWVSVCV